MTVVYHPPLRQDHPHPPHLLRPSPKIHRTYISDLERGARNPTITIIDKLATALGVKPGKLLD